MRLVRPCSDSEDGRAAPAGQPQDEAEQEEDEFEAMFVGAKARKRRGAHLEVGCPSCLNRQRMIVCGSCGTGCMGRCSPGHPGHDRLV